MANVLCSFIGRSIHQTSHQDSTISRLEVIKDAVSSSWSATTAVLLTLPSPLGTSGFNAQAFLSFQSTLLTQISFSSAQLVGTLLQVSSFSLFLLLLIIFSQVSVHQTLLTCCLCSWHCLDRNCHELTSDRCCETVMNQVCKGNFVHAIKISHLELSHCFLEF